VSVHLTKFRVGFAFRIIIISVIRCFRRLFLFQIMAQVKVRDSIASLGYMSDSEDEVVPTLPTPPIPPTKMLVFFCLTPFCCCIQYCTVPITRSIESQRGTSVFLYIISERVPFTRPGRKYVNLRKSIIQRQSDKQSLLGCSSVNYAEALFFLTKCLLLPIILFRHRIRFWSIRNGKCVKIGSMIRLWIRIFLMTIRIRIQI
jgi:hypothetical protein